MEIDVLNRRKSQHSAHMRVIKLLRSRDYWTSCLRSGKDPAGVNFMSGKSYCKLPTQSHLYDDTTYVGQGMHYKIYPLNEVVNVNCSMIWRTEKNDCVDGSDGILLVKNR